MTKCCAQFCILYILRDHMLAFKTVRHMLVSVFLHDEI